MIDPGATIPALEARLAGVDARRDPHEHATLAYRLGLAHAEAPTGDASQNLQRALQWYDTALAGFDERFDPVSHARVLNAAAAANRALGRSARAVDLFARAADLFDGRDRHDERAAALNNLGLARADQGDVDGAVAAFDAAMSLFGSASEEGRRGRSATLVNRGMALASTGDVGALAAAVESYRSAAEIVGDDAPYHRALADHSRGVAEMALAHESESDAAAHIGEAITAFESSLGFFTRTGFPYQHCLARHNLARALLALASLDHADRHRTLLVAFVHVEDAVAVLDPRMHKDEWTHAMQTLGRIEGELDAHGRGLARRQHFVALFMMSSPEERVILLANRLTRLLALPADARHAALRELATASVTGGFVDDGGLAYIGTELTVLTELPSEYSEAVLDARLDAHARLGDDTRRTADLALDQAVGDALNGPQRVFVRDFLSERGFERP